MDTETAASSAQNELQRRFPEMRPVKSPPALFRINGFGVGMYGRRNIDSATGTYIKTRCLCAIFIPIFPLDAYRVADAQGGGWYFIGKEKASGFARGSRRAAMILAAAFIGSISWSSHLQSPGYRAQKAREKGDSLVTEGRPLEAADTYRGAMQEGLGERTAWLQSITGLLRTEINSGDPKRAAAALRYADEKKVVPGSRDALIPDLASLAMSAAEKCGDPADAERILSSFRPAPSDLARVHETLKKTLEDLHKARPDDGEVRIKLALMREEFGEVDGALSLLEPAVGQLGEGEGARLYGKLLLNEGRVADALPHLESYVTPRLKEWQQVEGSVEEAYQTAQQRALHRLNESGGPPGFKRRYDAASEAEKGRMVDEYLSEQLRKDSSIVSAQERYEQAAKIVPSIMDLGVARLRMAQGESDPEKRKELLKGAEEAFLSLKSAAGESDEYRLFLGQIYFWSGRESEGRELFEALLATKKRDVETLFALGNIFRELGEENDARILLEEAFPKASSQGQKDSIASLRSILARDTEEKISWLTKADAATPGIAVRLAEAKGQKAESAGQIDEAKRYYREALAGYEKIGRSSSTLNNSALLYRSLYGLEGNPADFEMSARLASEAVELQPADSILSYNAAESLLAAAALRVIGDRVHPKLLQFEGGFESLRYLYQRQSEKDQLVAALKADPNYRKSLTHFWDALLLAPKNLDIYSHGAAVFAYLGDEESLQRLLEKASEQDFDFTSRKESIASYLTKQKDGEVRDSIKNLRARTKTLCEGLDPRSRAMAQCSIASTEIAGFTIGEPVREGAWLDELKAAQKTAPCSRLRSTLETSLQVIAVEKLAKDDPECAVIIEVNRRLVSTGDILTMLVRARGELGERVRKHPAVIAARQATSGSEELFPTNFMIDDWLLLDGLHPESDQKLKELVKNNRLDSIARRLHAELQPEGPSLLLEQLWTEVLEGDEPAARELLPKLEAAGVRMPAMF